MRSPGELSRWRGWILLALAVSACSRTPSPPQAAAAKRYTVRGEVVSLPARPEGELLLRHEAIPDFADGTGKVVGMAAMVMPFPAPASASLQGLAPGDKVQFVLLVDWAGPRYVIERIEKLPADTRLELGGRPMKATGASEASR